MQSADPAPWCSDPASVLDPNYDRGGLPCFERSPQRNCRRSPLTAHNKSQTNEQTNESDPSHSLLSWWIRVLMSQTTTMYWRYVVTGVGGQVLLAIMIIHEHWCIVWQTTKARLWTWGGRALAPCPRPGAASTYRRDLMRLKTNIAHSLSIWICCTDSYRSNLFMRHLRAYTWFNLSRREKLFVATSSAAVWNGWRVCKPVVGHCMVLTRSTARIFEPTPTHDTTLAYSICTRYIKSIDDLEYPRCALETEWNASVGWVEVLILSRWPEDVDTLL